MFRKFESVEETDEYMGRSVYIEDVRTQFIECKIEGEVLYLIFEYEDGTIEKLTSECVLITAQIDGHPFGYEINKKFN